MTEPTTQEFLDAANWTYAANPPFNQGYLPPPPDGMRVLTANGAPLIALDDGTGFYAAALVTTSNQVIVAFEGTSPDQIVDGTVFGIAQVLADADIYAGTNPPAYAEALAFTKTALADAAQQGIGGGDVFVSGHSLGAGEAEYVASQTSVAGDTFAAPGLPSADLGRFDGADLTDYIQHGDPVANYAVDSGVDRGFLHSTSIVHYGQTNYIGTPSDDRILNLASALIPLGGASTDTGIGLVALAASLYHPATTYYASLGLTPPASSPAYDYGTVLLTLEKIVGASHTASAPSFLGASDISSATYRLLALASTGPEAQAKAGDFLQLQAPAVQSTTPALQLAPAAPVLVAGDSPGHALLALVQSHHA
jgi:hypothetical protein